MDRALGGVAIVRLAVLEQHDIAVSQLAAEIEIPAGAVEQGVIVSVRITHAQCRRRTLEADRRARRVSSRVCMGRNLDLLLAFAGQCQVGRKGAPWRVLSGGEPGFPGALHGHPSVLHDHHAPLWALALAEVDRELRLEHDVLGAARRESNRDAIKLLSHVDPRAVRASRFREARVPIFGGCVPDHRFAPGDRGSKGMGTRLGTAIGP